jgi:hypothetical protein
MTITVIPLQEAEISKKINITEQDGLRAWAVQGTFEEAAAYTALAIEVPATIDGAQGDTLYLDKLTCKTAEADVWIGIAKYMSQEEKEAEEQKEKNKNPPDEIEWDFDTTGATAHITHSFGTKVFSAFQSNQPFTAYSNAINVKRTKTGFEVKGTTVIVPNLEFSVSFPVPPGTIGPAWIKDIARATGKKNSVQWKTFDAGEVLFKGARIKLKRWNKTVLAFNFKASENITEAAQVKIGEIGPIIAGGHDYVWVEWENVDVNNGVDGVQIFPRARYVFVEEVYRSFDLNQIGIP